MVQDNLRFRKAFLGSVNIVNVVNVVKQEDVTAVKTHGLVTCDDHDIHDIHGIHGIHGTYGPSGFARRIHSFRTW